MSFRIGQKVVCVNSDGLDDSGPTIRLNEIYTISWVGMHMNPWYQETKPNLCIHLDEVSRHPPNRDPRYAVTPYSASRFRPIVERKTDISTLTEMLKTDRVPALSTAD